MNIRWDIYEGEDTFVENEKTEVRQIDVYEDEQFGVIRSFCADVENISNIRVAAFARTGHIIKPRLLSYEFNGDLEEVKFYVSQWEPV